VRKVEPGTQRCRKHGFTGFGNEGLASRNEGDLGHVGRMP
jgi:hypothetical protein